MLFRLAVLCCFLSVVCCSLIVGADKRGPTVDPTEPPRLNAYRLDLPNAQSSAVAEALNVSYGSAVEAVTGFVPFYLTGDFNGDGMQDIVIVVRIKERRTALPKDVRLVNPFWYGPKVTFPTDLAAEPKLAFAIIHGWKIPKSATRFLLVGAAPLLIFDYGRTSSPSPGDAKGLMELMSKRGKRPRGQIFPRTAKGDVILLWTQVGDDTPLYWNGRTYKWEEGSFD
jgi:hypothetical protein